MNKMKTQGKLWKKPFKFKGTWWRGVNRKVTL